jgi:hypothetical protein
VEMRWLLGLGCCCLSFVNRSGACFADSHYHAMYCMFADAVSVYVPLYTSRAREPNGHVYGVGVVVSLALVKVHERWIEGWLR